MCTTELIAPVNRRRDSQWPQPHDLVTIASVLSCVYVCVLIRPVSMTDNTNDVYLGGRPSSSSIDVSVSSMSSLSRYIDVTTTPSSTRHRRVIITMSKSSSLHCRSRQRHRCDDDVVPRRRVVDNAVDVTMKPSVTTSSLSRDDDDVRTISTSLQRRDNGVSVVVSTSMLS